MSSTPTIVAAEMWSVTSFGDQNKRFDKFINTRRSAIKSFVEDLIIYEKIYVPTDDFMSLSILLHLFGERSILILIDEGALEFVRVKGALAYVGNGGGA